MINMQSVSLAEAKQSIINLGNDVPIFLCGEPGIGKTAMVKKLPRSWAMSMHPWTVPRWSWAILVRRIKTKRMAVLSFYPTLGSVCTRAKILS